MAQIGDHIDIFTKWRSKPKLDIYTKQNHDFYEEFLYYCRNGFETFKNGRRYSLTGRHFFVLNCCPMPIAVIDRNGRATGKFSFGYPYWSQEDDRFFRLVDEAEKASKNLMLFTARGFGKSIISLGGVIMYNYHMIPSSKNIVSASTDDNANTVWRYLNQMMTGFNQYNPTLSLKTLHNNTDYIQSGYEVSKFTAHGIQKEIKGHFSDITRVAYGNRKGKTKSLRIDGQLYDEVGSWEGTASLRQCYDESQGTLSVGGIRRGLAILLGTGGAITNPDALEMFNNPDTYNLLAYDRGRRKTAHLFFANQKYGGTWEKTGYSDIKKANEILDAKLEEMEDGPSKTTFKKEYPRTETDFLGISSYNNFNYELLALSFEATYQLPEEEREGKFYVLSWISDTSTKVQATEVKSTYKGSKVWLKELPRTDYDGNVPKGLYIAGYDGIDMAKSDTSKSYQRYASNGVMAIKRRHKVENEMTGDYVGFYVFRPKDDIEEFYRTCLQLNYFFNAIVNIEYTKIGIEGYYKKFNALHWIAPRPKVLEDKKTVRTVRGKRGTTATARNFEYAELYLKSYIDLAAMQIKYLPALEQLMSFNMNDRKQYDIVIAMLMTEILDMDSLRMGLKSTNNPMPQKLSLGYSSDKNGRKFKENNRNPIKNDNPLDNFVYINVAR